MKTSLAAVALLFAATALPPAAAQAADAKGPRLPGAQDAYQEARMLSPDTIVTGSIVPNDFSVVFLADLQTNDPARAVIERKASDPLRRAAARDAVNANPAVLTQLREQNIDAINVVAVERDADGSNVIYIR